MKKEKEEEEEEEERLNAVFETRERERREK